MYIHRLYYMCVYVSIYAYQSFQYTHNTSLIIYSVNEKNIV